MGNIFQNYHNINHAPDTPDTSKENINKLLQQIGVPPQTKHAIKKYIELVPVRIGETEPNKEELLKILSEAPSHREDIIISFKKISNKEIKKLIAQVIQKIDSVFRTLDLTYKQIVISEYNGDDTPPYIVSHNHLYPLDKIDDIVEAFIKEHQEGIKSDLKRISPTLVDNFDQFLRMALKIYFKNTTVEEGYAIATGEKDPIFDTLRDDIQDLYGEFIEKTAQKHLFQKIREKDSFGISQEFLDDLKQRFPFATTLKRPTSSYIRKILKDFHKDFTIYSFGSEEFLKLNQQFKGGPYIKERNDLHAPFTYIFVANYLFQKEMIEKLFSYYLQWTLFNKAKTSHQQNIKKITAKNIMSAKQYTSYIQEVDSEKTENNNHLSPHIKDFFQTILQEKYNAEIEDYITRIINNKGSIDISFLNKKFSLNLSDQDLTAIKQQDTNNIIRPLITTTDDNTPENPQQKTAHTASTELLPPYYSIIEEALENNDNFTAKQCISLFKAMGYDFLNEGNFTKTFNDSFKGPSGAIRKQQLIHILHRHIKHHINIWKSRSYRKLEVIEIKHEAYRFVKKGNTIRGIYSHQEYERSAYLWLK